MDEHVRTWAEGCDWETIRDPDTYTTLLPTVTSYLDWIFRDVDDLFNKGGNKG